MKKTDNIFIVYRDNDLFEKEIPKVADILSSVGNQVESYGFSRSTGYEEIERWYEKNEKLLANKTIISDRTASPPFKLEKILSSLGTKHFDASLDNIFSDAIEKAVFKNEYKNLHIEKTIECTERESKKWFNSVFRKILDVPENKPDEVAIFIDNILDHSHAYDYSYRGALNKTKYELLQRNTAEEFKGWLIEGGLEQGKIKIIQENILTRNSISGKNYIIYGKENIVREKDKSEYWIIVDRHARNIVKEIKNAKCLRLPESNFYEDARDYGLLKYTDEDLYKSLGKVLKNVMKESKK